jgi:hypothetical protein
MANPVVHFEIVGKDQEALKDVYRQTFDWEIDSNNPVNYGMVNTGVGIGGGDWWHRRRRSAGHFLRRG